MPLTNPWIGYLQRTYEQIKQALLTRVQTLTPEVTDLSESNLLVIIVGMFSGVAEMLSYYIDNMAREGFLETCQRFVSVKHLVSMLDYRIKTSLPAGVDLIFSFEDSSQQPVGIGANTVLPAGTMVRTQANMFFITPEDTPILAGKTSVKAKALQYLPVVGENLGNTSGLANQKILLGAKVVYQSVNLLINGVVWTETSTFAFSNPNSKVFLVDVDIDGLAYILFGDGVFGKIPTAGYPILADFKLSEGFAGNLINPHTITTLVTPLIFPGVTTVKVTNSDFPNGGSDYESFEQIKFRAPLSIRTLERFVTPQDGIDIANLHPSVYRARLDFCCERDACVKIYIAPVGGGIASGATLQGVQDWMDCKKIISIPKICVQAAGITLWGAKITAQARFRQDPLVTLEEVRIALTTFGSFENSDVNQPVRISDILSLLDSIPKVDYVNIDELFTLPYARPDGHNLPLNWVRSIPQTGIVKAHWRINYQSGFFSIFRDNIFLGNYPVGTVLNFEGLTFQTLPDIYGDGMSWTFTTWPVNKDQEIDDFTVPIIDPLNLNLTVNPAKGDNCKPACYCPNC